MIVDCDNSIVTLLYRNGVLYPNIGFANLSNPQAEDAAGKVYALFIGDTVLVNNVEYIHL